jgi:hypothetical protein
MIHRRMQKLFARCTSPPGVSLGKKFLSCAGSSRSPTVRLRRGARLPEGLGCTGSFPAWDDLPAVKNGRV